MRRTVLVADDEEKIADLARAYLESAGYRVVVAGDGNAALRLFEEQAPDCVVLDVGLPGPDGFEIAGRIRERGSTPIVFLTARVGEADRLKGFELGADDYVVKPFSPRELVARIGAVLRRSSPASVDPEEGPVRVGRLYMDPVRRETRVDGELKNLTASQFCILLALARRPGKVFSRMELLSLSSQEAFEGYERTIDAHVKNLRKSLGDDPRRPGIVATVRGVGYKLVDAPR